MISRAEQYGQNAMDALDALQQAGDQAAQKVGSGADDLQVGSPFGAQGPVTSWAGGQPALGTYAETRGCRTGELPRCPLTSRAVLARVVHGLDAGEDEIDAGEELLAVVVLAQLRSGFVHGRVSSGVELRPLRGDVGQEG